MTLDQTTERLERLALRRVARLGGDLGLDLERADLLDDLWGLVRDELDLLLAGISPLRFHVMKPLAFLISHLPEPSHGLLVAGFKRSDLLHDLVLSESEGLPLRGQAL